VVNQIQDEFEYPKGIIRICKSKERQHNGQMANNDLLNITNKTKDRVKRTSLKIKGELSTFTTEHKCVQGVCKMSQLLPTPQMHRRDILGKVDNQ
jgi:hypothetical protein